MKTATWKRWMITLGLLAGFLVGTAAVADDKLQVTLAAYQADRVTLLAGTTYIGGTLLVDSTDRVNLVFGSPLPDLSITLTSPSGGSYSSGDDDRDGVHSTLFPDPQKPGVTGVNYVFTIESPEPGLWSYSINAAQPTTRDVPVFVQLYSESPIRGAVMGGGTDYTVGQEMTMSVVVMNDMAPLDSYSVQGTVNLDQPNAATITLSFADDGAPGDAVAGDGISTTHFTPQETGRYWFKGWIDGTDDYGNPFTRSLNSSFRVIAAKASFTGGFADRGIDLDSDGYFDALGIAMLIDVAEAGDYILHVTITTAGGSSLTAVSRAQMGLGIGTMETSFTADDLRAQGEDGPYNVSNALLEYVAPDDSYRVDRLEVLGQTAPWILSQFQRDPIELTGVLNSYGTDYNGNGLFDLLTVDVGLDLTRSGYYQWSGRLIDSSGTELGFVASAGYLNAGQDSIGLGFAGQPIGENGVDGPYQLSNLIVFDNYDSVTDNRAGQTAAFLASQFEGYVNPDTEPPILSLTVSPTELWPVNHKMVEIGVEVQVSDDQDPSPEVMLESVSSSDGEDELGDGHHSPDIEITEDGRVFLRAERSGLNADRVYTILYKARDEAGNVATAEAIVTVPHDQ